MKFDKELLIGIVEKDTLDYKIVNSRIVDSGRWDIVYETIFKNVETGEMFVTCYSRGATEYQEYDLYDGEPDEIECPKVNLESIRAEAYVTEDGGILTHV